MGSEAVAKNREWYYLFGIVKNGKPSSQGLATDKLRAVYDLVDASDFCEEALAANLRNMEWVQQHAANHQHTLTLVSQEQTVIPLKFGAVFRSKASVLKMLRDREEEFECFLDRFHNTSEWGVKLYCEEAQLSQWLCAHSQPLITLDRKIQSATPGGAFLLKKKKEVLLKEALKEMINQERKRLFEVLRDMSAHSKVLKETTRELTRRNGSNVFNMALLISEETQRKLADFQEAAKVHLRAKGMHLELSGPWPPYSFVTHN